MLDTIKLIVATLIVVASVAAYYQFGHWLQVVRVGVILGAVAAAAALVFTTDKGRGLFAFLRGANVERQKMVWPVRREAVQVTGVVVVMVIVFGLYLWLLDTAAFYGVYDLILGL